MLSNDGGRSQRRRQRDDCNDHADSYAHDHSIPSSGSG
jgi:hypothetical protein